MATFDDGRRAARDVFIAAVIVVFVVWPAVPGRMLSTLKITHAALPGGAEVDFATEQHTDAVQQANAVSKVADQAQLLQTLIAQALQAAPDSPALKRAGEVVGAILSGTDAADAAVKNTLVAQQAVLAPNNAIPPLQDGWIYLGRVDASQQGWRDRISTDAPSPQLDRLKGATLTLTENTFLRRDAGPLPADKPRGFRLHQPIQGVLKRGSQVRVVNAELDPAEGGGMVVWAQVTRV